MGTVNFNVPLENEYARLAVRERALRKTLENGTAVCSMCNRPKSVHGVHDMRCNSYVTSTQFTCTEQFELVNVSTALQVIEDLRIIGEK
jgi:hypothetical protein